MNKLKFYREKANLSQESLAIAFGCSSGAISHYETGRRDLRRNSMEKFVKILNENGAKCSIVDVFFSSDKKSTRAA